MSPDLDALLLEVARLGIRLEARGDILHFHGPRGTLTPELRDRLIQHKPALLARLGPSTYIALKGGPVVPAQAIRVAVDLEARGFRQSLDPDQQYQVEPTPVSGPLTPDDRTAIARWRLHLGAVVAYEAPTCA